MKRLLGSQYIGFFTIGSLANIVALLLINIREDIVMNYSQAGIILSGQFFGMFLTVIIGGLLADKYGKKLYIMVGSFTLLFGLLGCMISVDFVQLLIACIITGIGFGVYEAGMSALCVEGSEDDKGNAMNLLSFFYSFGAIIIPGFSILCLRYIGDWRIVFGLMAILPLLVILLLLPIKIDKRSDEIIKNSAAVFKDPYIWLIGFAAFSYVGTEVSIYGWLPTLWNQNGHLELISTSLIVSIFWIALTIGRLIVGRIADRIGLGKFIILSSLLTLITAIGWVTINIKIWPLISVVCLGFTLSGIFPTIIASAGSYEQNSTATVTAFVLTLGAMGGFLTPVFIGNLADVWGIEILPLIIAFLALFMLIVSFITWGYVEKKMLLERL